MTRFDLSSHVPFVLAALCLGTVTACSGVRHATRDGLSREARAVELVKVQSTAMETGYRMVSFSSWDVALVDDLPAEAPPDVVADMREEAAAHGAETLLLERYESDYRKAFYGVGAVADELAPKHAPVCGHPTFKISIDKARAAANDCAAKLKRERPLVQGSVTIAFEIDPDGGVLRAVATPDSSRDSALQACALEAVHQASWGIPLEFTCQARLAVDIGAGTP